jgi:hypothetical protein
MFKGQNVFLDISTFALEYQDLICGASYSRRMESSATLLQKSQNSQFSSLSLFGEAGWGVKFKDISFTLLYICKKQYPPYGIIV